MYPVWEVERWRNGGARELEPAFAGAQDHAHNDFLEFLTDYGIAGLTAWLAALAAILGFAWRHARGEKSPLLFGVSAGIVALCGVALVDFPFQRPTEVFFFWSLAAILFSPSASIPNSSPRREIDS
jgi:O-antigen ligase